MQNSLIEAARSGRPPAYWRILIYFLVAALGIPFAAATGITLCALLVVAAQQGATSPQDMFAAVGDNTFNFVVGGLFEVGSIVMTVIWVRSIDRRPITSIGLSTRRPLSEWLRGLGVGAGLMLLAVGLMAALGGIRSDGNTLGSPASLPGVLAALIFFVVQGPAEEVVFRGYLLPTLSARGSIASGIGVSSVAFGLLHALNPNFSVLPLVNIVLAGVMFALYALLEEGLWGVFGLHTAWNWVQGNVLGLAVSGGQFGPSVLALSETGPDWLTGGGFGPEGSALVTLLLAGVSGWLGWRLWRREQAHQQEQGAAS